ncbi:hypothetical protein AB0I84_18495 [Streptomyces spectabilis]
MRYELVETAHRLLSLTGTAAKKLLRVDAVDPLSLLEILTRPVR